MVCAVCYDDCCVEVFRSGISPFNTIDWFIGQLIYGSESL